MGNDKETARRYYQANKETIKKRSRDHAVSNPESRKKIARKCHLKRAYGMTVEEWEQMFESQKRKCAVCGIAKPGGRYSQWCTDHCHVTGLVRGILCHNCNTLIGHAKDDRSVLLQAGKYLQNHAIKKLLSNIARDKKKAPKLYSA